MLGQLGRSQTTNVTRVHRWREMEKCCWRMAGRRDARRPKLEKRQKAMGSQQELTGSRRHMNLPTRNKFNDRARGMTKGGCREGLRERGMRERDREFFLIQQDA